MKSERGQYRAITVVLLDGPDFQKLPPEARWVFVALKISLGPCGIQVEYPAGLIEKLAGRTGFTQPVVAEMLNVLQATGWIRTDRNVVWVVKQLKFEPAMTSNNEKHRTAVAAHAKGLPTLAIVGDFIREYRAYFADWEELTKCYPKPDEAQPIGYTIAPRITETEDRDRIPKTDEVAFASQTASRSDDEITDGQVMAAIREHLYAPDGIPPEGWSEGREFSVMRSLRKLGKSGSQIRNVVEGLGCLLRDERVDWLRGKATLRAVFNSSAGVLDMWGQAEDAYYKQGNTFGKRPKSRPEDIRAAIQRELAQAKRGA